MKQRLSEIEYFKKNPFEIQEKNLQNLLKNGKNTLYGKNFNFTEIKNSEAYKKNVPIVEYENLYPYINKIIEGKKNVLWNSPIRWMAKSSGTTNDKSKYIPVSKQSFKNCHYRAARDVLGTYAHNFPNSKIFEGKGIILGGNHQIHSLNKNIKVGDLSALLVQNMSNLGRFLSSINLKLALHNDWNEKLEKLANYYIPQNVSNILGVPSWMLVFLKKVLEISGKNAIVDLWENLELYIHGGVNFEPYKQSFEQIIGKPINYQQTYNASEGFFAMQDTAYGNDMLLMLDLGIYFEFLPIKEIGKKHAKTLNLQEVELGKTYALIISTESGLWRYNLGDTVEFTNLNPFRIIINGRTKQFINVFGEELMVDNAEKAIAFACEKTYSTIVDYTVAPIFMDNDAKKGGHEWAIAFKNPPQSINQFSEILDLKLKELNSDYEAKRYDNKILQAPKIKVLAANCFDNWLKNKNKLGGQNKIPRLSNKRDFLEEIYNFCQ